MKHPIDILGVPIFPVSFDEAVDCILHFLKQPGQHTVVTANPEIVLHAHRHTTYRHILQKASLVVPDGVGLRWAAWILQKTFQWKRPRIERLFCTGLFGAFRLFLFPWSFREIPERVCGVDLVRALAAESMHRGFSIFLLGAQEGVADELKMLLEKEYPGVHIVGTHSGSPSPRETKHICSLINAASPNVLFVAYGAPAQEIWISKHLASLQTVKIAMGVGGSFDFLTSRQKRAPRIFRLLSIEWLYRLFLQPRRFQRIFRAVILFPKAVLRSILDRRAS